MLYFPDRECWTTFTALDTPELEYDGGHALVSRGRTQSPLSLTYGWNKDADRYWFEIASLPTTSLISASEFPTEVAHAKTELEAVNAANETAGGEADIIADVAQGAFGLGQIITLHTGEIPGAGLDQHEEAIAYLTRRVKELVQ